MVRFRQLIARAKAKRIHEALGFKSWTAYVADVIGIEMTKLPVDDRRQIVALLAGEGIESTGDCAVVGVSQKTVDRDLDQVSHDDSPADRVITEPMHGHRPTTARPTPSPSLSRSHGRRGPSHSVF